MTLKLKQQLKDSILAGLEYVLKLQAPDGHWTDWNLPPGNSLAWTTGYIGFKLRSLPDHWTEKAACARVAAANWLLRHQFPDGGWGYNESVGSDADSTAFAILCISSAGLEVPDMAYEHLSQYQCADGGFSTFLDERMSNSWSVSHPDVTPIALRALLSKHSIADSTVRNGLDYVVGQKTSEGIWNSFWWDTPLYSTEANLALLRSAMDYDATTTEESLCSLRPLRVFEIALLISSLLLIATVRACAAAIPLLEQLIRKQRPDGGWNSDAILRITSRDCYKPWDCANAGPLFEDPQRLFTSSAVIASLATAYSTAVFE
jgi:hypothetical protein